MKVSISKAAEKDIQAIGDWIASDNPERAGSFTDELVAAAFGLADMPRRFPLIDRYKKEGIRSRLVGVYLILYRIAAHEIEILRILHGARDYHSLLDIEADGD